MEAYFIKTSLCLLVLYALYRLILQNERNHQVKRFVGLACVIFACIFLFIPLGSLWVADTYPQVINVVFIQGSEGLQEGISRVITDEVVDVYLIVYVIGFAAMTLRSLLGFFTLVYWYATSKRVQKWGFTVVEVNRTMTPFTFFNILFIGTMNLDEKSMETLIVHEQYHKTQWHSIDTVLLELLTLVFWFNPIVWLFRKDIKTIHEFMADAHVLNKGHNKLDYQQLLFQTKTGVALTIGSHFSDESNLKKRISMMNQQQKATKYSIHKALLFLPIMGIILVLSGFAKANNDLSRELKMFQQQSVRDSIPALEAMDNETFQSKIRNAVVKEEGKKPLYILKDGKKERIVSFDFVKKLKRSEVATMYILKNKVAKDKYGAKGENGVVVFELKKKKNE